MKNYWIKLLFGIGVILAVVAGCGSDNDNKNDDGAVAPDAGADKTRSYLFVQNAGSGTFLRDANGSYTLTLEGVAPQTIYFSDRPVRDAGQVPMQTFVKSSCFDISNPPNAAVDVLDEKGEASVIVVELLDPLYDTQSATLRYTARIVPDDVNHSVDRFNQNRADTLPESFGSVALFIDDCSDTTVHCGDKYGNEAGEVKCCRCWSWDHGAGCNFQSDCCSFARCQDHCTDKYGSENKYIRIYCPHGTPEPYRWVDNVHDYYNSSCQ